MSKFKYTDEFLRIAEYVENMEHPDRGLYSARVFQTLNIFMKEGAEKFTAQYREAVVTENYKDISYFDQRLDPAVRPLLFCFLHAILSSGDSLQ